MTYRPMIALAAGSALSMAARAPADDGSAAAVDTPLRRTIKIAGENFEVAAPYKAGHQLNEAEASVLNQTFAENVRNNVAGKIKSAQETFTKDEANKGKEFSLDTVMVPGEEEGQTITLRQSLTNYADAYEFGIRSTRTSEPLDPVEREARVIARETLNSKIKASGNKRSAISDEAYEQALGALAGRADIVKEAKRRVEQRTKIGSDELDLDSLLAGVPDEEDEAEGSEEEESADESETEGAEG